MGRPKSSLTYATVAGSPVFFRHYVSTCEVERTRLTYLCEVITDLDARLIVDRRELDDHVQGFALLTSGGRTEVIGQVGTDAK